MNGSQYMGISALDTKKVYFAGTDTLQEGYALCYVEDATPPSTSSIHLALGVQVEKPTANNLLTFAGFVSANSAGKTGPGWIEIVVPRRGEYVTAYTKENMTAGTTALVPVASQWYLSAGTIGSGDCMAIAGQTANTSVTAANKYVMFL